MGVIYSPETVIAGHVPEADGSSHVAAREEVIGIIRTDSRMRHDVKATVYGSAGTGNANRRSDFDVFLTYFAPAGEAAFTQQAAINGLLTKVSKAYNVSVESKRYSEDELTGHGARRIDPMYAGHIFDIEADFPECSHLKPVHQLLSQQALSVSGVTASHLPLLTQATINYAENRSSMFLEASGGGLDLKKLQRAFELPKALGRKTLILCDVTSDLSTDVTNKAHMNARLKALFEQFSGSEHMNTLHERLNNFDEEYSEVLEQAIASGGVGEYQRWLDGSHEEAYRLAYRFSSDFGVFIRTILPEYAEAILEINASDDQDMYEDD